MRDYLVEEVALDFGDALLTRREALRRLGLLGLSATGAAALLAACGGGDDGDGAAGSTTTSTSAPPATAPEAAEDITFAGPRGELLGAWAAAPDPEGAVL
ncbi:MAG TPA: dienelactone hydrolase family protein, partial [Acidimicrobiia bacterium]